MPIDFAPPQSNVNYNITPPQYTDPLQTLAQMGQLRTQGIQQQTAQMQLEQERRKMDSQKGVIRWLADMNKPEATQETQPAAPAAPSPAPSADTGTGGFTPISGYTPVTQPPPAPVATAPAAQPQPQPSSDSGFLGRMARDAGKYGILPDDWFAIQNHYLDYKQKSATLSEAQKKIDSDNADAMAGAYRQLAQNKTADQGDLNAVNNSLIARGVPREWLMTALPAGHGDVTPQMMIQAHGNTQLKLAQILENEQKQSSAAASQATVTKEGVLTDEAKQKVDAGEKAAVAQELQNADTDEAGTPTPAAAAAIQQRHPKVILPTTKAGIDRFIRSVVPAEKQPEYDLNTNKARLGMMGNSEFDQFLVQHARSIKTPDAPNGKTPAQLTPDEFNLGLQKYKEFTQDPTMRAIAIGQKGLQEAMLRAQLGSMPTPEDIDMYARMAINHEMSPDQFSQLRTGRTAFAGPIMRRAKQIDPTFNPARLEAEYKTMTDAEKEFGPGPKGDMARANSNTIEHMGQLDLARRALGTNNIPLLRSISQSLGIQFGGDASTTYDLIAKKVGDEFTKSFIPGAGGEKERAEAAADFRRQLGDTQISSNIKAAIHAMDVQQQNLIKQYNRSTYGKGTQGDQLFTPEAMAVRNRLLGNAPAQQGGGMQYTQQRRNPQTGHVIGLGTDNKWHDVQTGAVIQ